MKCLAIADLLIDKQVMEKGLQKLKEYNIDITIREWKHNDIEALQKDNINLEKNGSDAVELPKDILKDADTFDIVITQFAPLNKDTIDKFKNIKIIGVLKT